MNKPYDPKLREAAEEFKTLCQKYDCMASAIFCSPTHSEFVHHFGASWSVARPEGVNGFRFRSKESDFFSKEEQHRCTEATVHGIHSMGQWGRMLSGSMISIIEQLSKHMRILSTVWGKPDSVPGDGK